MLCKSDKPSIIIIIIKYRYWPLSGGEEGSGAARRWGVFPPTSLCACARWGGAVGGPPPASMPRACVLAVPRLPLPALPCKPPTHIQHSSNQVRVITDIIIILILITLTNAKRRPGIASHSSFPAITQLPTVMRPDGG